MCGRFTLTVDLLNLLQRWQIAEDSEKKLRLEYQPSYNISPGQSVLAIAAAKKEIRAGFLHWGLKLFPSQTGLTINARAETAHEKISFAKLIKNRRCIIPADGFYEWEKQGETKNPFYLYLNSGKSDNKSNSNQLFALAALWDRKDSKQTNDANCVILTQAAPPALKHIHHRMPVVLTAEDEYRWLYEGENQLSNIMNKSQELLESSFKYHQVS